MSTQAVTHEEPQKFRREIDLKDGSGVQVFEADTAEGLIDKLAQAQEHATRKIREQNKQLKIRAPHTDPAKTVESIAARSLTVDEQFMLAQELQDPAKAPGAIKKVIEAELGAPIEELRESVSERRQRRLMEEAIQEGNQFKAENPDYFDCPANNQLMQDWLAERNLGCTKRNFQAAYEDLRELLKPKEVPKTDPEPRIETPAPRRTVQTGIRPSQGTASPGADRPKWTRAQINAMSPEEYKQNLANPEFRNFVNNLR